MKEMATPAAIASLRHRAAEFAAAHGAGRNQAADVALAVSEAATNAVKYAYLGATRNAVVEPAALGLGLSIMASLSAELTIVQEGEGTEVRMRFPLPQSLLARAAPQSTGVQVRK